MDYFIAKHLTAISLLLYGCFLFGLGWVYIQLWKQGRLLEHQKKALAKNHQTLHSLQRRIEQIRVPEKRLKRKESERHLKKTFFPHGPSDN